MKEQKTGYRLVTLIAFLSALAMKLRTELYTAAVDGKGLLISGHPLKLALWAVIGVGVVLILSAVRKADGDNAYEDNFGPSKFAALGQCVMGCAVLLTALLHTLPLGETVTRIWENLGILCGPGMIWNGLRRMKGKTPFFGVHAALTVFLLLYLVSRYQLWSGNPQLQDYIFTLLALVCMTLFAYHCAAFEAGMGNRRLQLTFGLLTVLLCGAAAFRAQVPGLYAGGLVWAVTNLCRLDPPPKKDEVDAHEPA